MRPKRRGKQISKCILSINTAHGNWFVSEPSATTTSPGPALISPSTTAKSASQAISSFRSDSVQFATLYGYTAKKFINHHCHPRTANPKANPRLPSLSRNLLLEEQHCRNLCQEPEHVHPQPRPRRCRHSRHSQGWTVFAIEVKAAKGKVAPHQQAFLNEIAARGGVAFVARSIEDVQQKLNGNIGSNN